MVTKDVVVKEWADYEYRKLMRSVKFITDDLLVEMLQDLGIPAVKKWDAIYVG